MQPTRAGEFGVGEDFGDGGFVGDGFEDLEFAVGGVFVGHVWDRIRAQRGGRTNGFLEFVGRNGGFGGVGG